MAESFTGTILINEALEELGVIAPGETTTATILAKGLRVLNGVLASASVEGIMNPRMFSDAPTPNLTSAIDTYTVSTAGGGGDWVLNYAPIRIISWKAVSGNFRAGGQVLPMSQFRDEVNKRGGHGTLGVLPEIVGGEIFFGSTASGVGAVYRLDVWPIPSSSPGTITLDYFTGFDAFANVVSTYYFPDGWFDFLSSQLAINLAPTFPRVGGVPEALAARAARAKEVIMQKNMAIQGLGTAAAA